MSSYLVFQYFFHLSLENVFGWMLNVLIVYRNFKIVGPLSPLPLPSAVYEEIMHWTVTKKPSAFYWKFSCCTCRNKINENTLLNQRYGNQGCRSLLLRKEVEIDLIWNGSEYKNNSSLRNHFLYVMSCMFC